MGKLPKLAAAKSKNEDSAGEGQIVSITSPKNARRTSQESEVGRTVKAMLKRGGSMQSLLSLGSRKSNRSGSSGGFAGARLPSTAQTIAGAAACILVTWIGSVSVLLMMVALRYNGPVVDLAREGYVLAAAERVGSEAVQVLGAADAARQVVDYAVQRQLYFEPQDYDGVRLALEPVFAARKPLRAVDMTFDTRNVSITLRRVVGAGIDRLLVQSDSEDCFEKLGRFGCLDGAPFREMSWFQIGLKLPGGQEADNSTGPPMSFQWNEGPGFVPHVEGALVQSARAVAWSPAHSLIFRSVFPGSRGNLSVIARAVVEVTEVASEDRLDDKETLGDLGAIYVCDASGTLISTLMPGQKALIESPTGAAHFRSMWELSGWAAEVGKQYFEEARQSGTSSFQAGTVHVAIRAVRGNHHFFVVAASQRNAFADPSMELICSAAQGIVVSPYPAVAIVLVLCFILIQINARRKKRRVQPEERLAQAEKSLAMLRSRTVKSERSLSLR